MVDDDAADQRVERLLEQILESGQTPEELCHACPELLPEVRAGLRQLRQLEEDVSALFPPSDDGNFQPPRFAPPEELPSVPGYEVLGVLGHGGMGIVFRARHLRLNRPVALKMILAGPYARREELERFLHEAKSVAALCHPNVVEVYDAGEFDGRPYFTMELVEGGRLSEMIAGVPQPAREAVALVAAVAGAVHAAHEKGIVHRDLKPSNILLTPEGLPKVTDFGLAHGLESDSALTVTGVTIGTPSYMAPEQARGDKAAISPAIDVYSLGAILYELLTGRPPFRAETATATLQHVLNEEPVPPARLNPRVPRDLDTICLKCLCKEPPRRYPSAAALADDLHRFQRGDPITARPPGVVERGARWLRSHRALAVGAALIVFLTAFGAWRYAQQAAAERAASLDAEVELRQAEQLRDRGEYASAAIALERAKLHLGTVGSAALHERIGKASNAVALVRRLDAIRLERALVKPPAELLGALALPPTEHGGKSKEVSDAALSGRHYEEAFREAGIGAPGGEPAAAAAEIRASPVRGALVAALDDWAACATNPEQQAWVLAVARQADPDPWRDLARDPATWDDPAALRALADRAPVAQQSPQLLSVLAARLRAKNLDAAPLLDRAISAYPADFWVNIEMGNSNYARHDQPNLLEAAGYYRTAVALRPGTTSLHYALGGMYLGLNFWDRAIAEYEKAVRLDPQNPWCHNRLGIALAWKGGRDDEAVARFREAIRIDPDLGWSHSYLAIALERQGRLAEAADEFREAARLLPEKHAQWKRDGWRLLLKLGHAGEVRDDWKRELAAEPREHDDWFGYAELCLFLGDEAEYRRARRELLAHFGSTTDLTVAERTGRTCLLLPGSEDELRQAVALTERAVAAGRPGRDFVYPYCVFAEGLARYRQERMNDASRLMSGEAASVMGPSPRLVLAMAQFRMGQKNLAAKNLAAALESFDWSTPKADSHDAWIAHILRREAEALIHPTRSGD